MNVSLHLHRAERPTVTCSQLVSGTSCLTINSVQGEVSIFGTMEQLEELRQSIDAALHPVDFNEADIYSEG